MAKDSVKQSGETIADKIAREKAEKDAADAKTEPAGEQQATKEKTAEEDMAEKMAANNAAGADKAPEPTGLTDSDEKGDPEFEAALNEPDTSTDADVEKAIAEDDDEAAIVEAVSGDDARSRSIAAAKKLRTIALDFQASSPDTHVIFGRASERFTLGDLRDLVGLPRAG